MENWSLVSVCVLLGLTTRWAVSFSSYSGAGKPPMFGDYEAQRHWQEVTYNLPVQEWYFNTTDNDLGYWGLDYPPLTAYHSLLCGHVAKLINPAWVELRTSRGFESAAHKLFMRTTVLFADILIYFPAVILYCIYLTLCILLYPGLILIDYGHFQYNSVSLALTLWGIVGLGLGWNLLGALAFSLALNYKQMELYHSLPFFCFLLGKCIKQGLMGRGLLLLVKISLTVLVTFALCWWPFLSDPQQILQVLHRLFPVDRGLFEDKVANTWCSLNVLIKIKTLLSRDTQLLLSFALTLLSILPSSIKLLTKPTLWQFKLALVNSSLAFFLFSFQVHEKSILLPAFSILNRHVNVYTFGNILVFFHSGKNKQLLMSLRVPFVADRSVVPSSFPEKHQIPCLTDVFFCSNRKGALHLVFLQFTVSLVAMAGLSFTSMVLEPPARLPDLFPVLVSVFSFLHFLAMLLYFNLVQLTEPSSKKSQKKTN
uniref:Alpha-1,3-glucosyltransferase n=1 Tax=Astyanax mexicanus TaxID=7994 RepID=A0A8B9HNW4_ASTMX